MCGSGTLAIEAALWASGRSPGLLRSHFGLLHLKLDQRPWRTLRAELGKRPRRKPAPIVASDIDARAVEAARRNAQTAGVSHLIDFHRCDFAQTPLPEDPGIVIFNPSYGERLEGGPDLEKTYERIGDFFKQRCGGGTGFLFTGNRELAKKVGLRTKRRLPFFNGQLECRLLKYELYAGSKKAHKSSQVKPQES